MKKILLILFSWLLIGPLVAQNLKPGYYVTDDGMNYRNIEVLNNGTIKASISTGYDIYEKVSENKYKGTITDINGEAKPASREFYLEIVSETSIYLYRAGSNKTLLRFKDTKKILESVDDCTLYKKYMDKMADEPENIQVLAFCANAALQLCNAPDDAARKAILEITVRGLKGLLPDKPCPCSDVIPADSWKKN